MKPIRICKICFNEISFNSCHNFLNQDLMVCSSCLKKLNQQFKIFKFYDYDALAIYNYDGLIKEKIFEFKGCGDYELNNIFIAPFKNELRILYKNYVIVPAPSFKDNNEKRGYNHVIEMFSFLKLEIVDCLIKTKDVYQHLSNFKEREKVKNIIELQTNYNFENKKILLVDDILTTGSTLKACIDLLIKKRPKNIKILVVAKRNFTKEEREKINKNYKIID